MGRSVQFSLLLVSLLVFTLGVTAFKEKLEDVAEAHAVKHVKHARTASKSHHRKHLSDEEVAESLQKDETELDEMGAEAGATSQTEALSSVTTTTAATTSAGPGKDASKDDPDSPDSGTVHRMEYMFGKLGGLEQKFTFIDNELKKMLAEKLSMERELKQMSQSQGHMKESVRRDTSYLRQAAERDASDLRAQEAKDIQMVEQKMKDLRGEVFKPLNENNEKMADFSKDMNKMRKRMEASIDDMKKDVKFQVDKAVINMKRDNENLAANYQQTAKWINQDIGEFEEMYRHIVTEKDQLEKKLEKTIEQMREGLMTAMHQKIEVLRRKNEELQEQYKKDIGEIRAGMGNINKQYEFFAQMIPFVKLHANEWLSNHEGAALSRFLDANAKDNDALNELNEKGPVALNEAKKADASPVKAPVAVAEKAGESNGLTAVSSQKE